MPRSTPSARGGAALIVTGGRILLQLLHSGRYGFHERIVAPSAVKSPINAHTPRAMSAAEIEQTIDDFAHAARLAREAGYDGVELMGSEGYLVTQFLAARTNRRADEWGIGMGGIGFDVALYLVERGSRAPLELGRTTGWVHRAELARNGVRMLKGVAYRRIDEAGVHIVADGKEMCIPADTVIICAGQEPRRPFANEKNGVRPHFIMR